jgi:uncharacterized protein (DUF433 family)
MAQPPTTVRPHMLVSWCENYTAANFMNITPLGQYIVQAPGVCGGRPTFKYTRLEPSVILAQLSLGRTVEDLLRDYHGSKISAESIYEAIYLANQAFMLVHNARLNEPEALEWNFA